MIFPLFATKPIPNPEYKESTTKIGRRYDAFFTDVIWVDLSTIKTKNQSD